MNWKLLASATVGFVLVAAAVVVGAVGLGPSSGDIPLALAVIVGLVVFGASVVKLLRTPDDETVAPAPWSEAGALVEDQPESTPETDRISGTELAETIETAASEVRGAETFEPGLAIVREPLREALVGALRQGGWSKSEIDTALAEGTWTDDPVAAAVLDERVTPPERSLRRRLWAWLFPERALRHRTALAVGAIARAAEETLPAVVGQHAPRPVPVPEPTVEDLRRAADGELRRAVEGRASVRSPEEWGAEADDRRDEPDAVDEESATDPAVAAEGENTSSADTGEPDGEAPSDSRTVEDEWPVAQGGSD